MRSWVEEHIERRTRQEAEHRVMENNPERCFASFLAEWMVDLELDLPFDWTFYEGHGPAWDHEIRELKFDTKNASYPGRPKLIVDNGALVHLKPLYGLILTHAQSPFKLGDVVEFCGVVSVERFKRDAYQHDFGHGPCTCLSASKLEPFEKLLKWQAEGEW